MKKTILLVDDQREVLLGIREFLSEMQMTDAEILIGGDPLDNDSAEEFFDDSED